MRGYVAYGDYGDYGGGLSLHRLVLWVVHSAVWHLIGRLPSLVLVVIICAALAWLVLRWSRRGATRGPRW